MNRIFVLLAFIGIFYHSTAQEQPADTLSLMFLGDIMSHGPQIRSAYDAVNRTYNYDENFQYLFPAFSQADFVVANLETTLGIKPYSGYPAFSAPAELVTACQTAGIDILATANNHSCDKGKKGIISTLNILDSLQIQHFGTYRNSKEHDSLTPLLIQHKGFKIALLNYTYGTNGLPIVYPTRVNLIDKKQIVKDINRAKSYQPDVIIAFLHWGIQYQSKASTRQKKLANFLHNNGVPIVIGSHPHVLQPIDYKQDKQTLTVYSLGNFISNQRTYPRDGSMAVTIKLIKNYPNKTKILPPETIPLWVYKFKENKKWHYQVLPVNDFKFDPVFFKSNADFQKMMRYLKYYKQIIDVTGRTSSLSH